MKNRFNFLRVFLLLLAIFVSGLIRVSAGEIVKKSVDDNQDDNNETLDDTKDLSMAISVENENNLTCTRRQNNQMHEIQTATYRQFPFMVAIVSHQNEYLCSGSVVSNGLILTTAQCIQEPISYVLLNTTKAKIDDNAIKVHVKKIEKFPSFTGANSPINVGLLYTEKFNSSGATKIGVSNFTKVRSIIDMEGLGFGLNADVGQTKELQSVGVELRSLSEDDDVMNGFFDCIDTKVLTCFKDTGGPVLFDNQLIGVVKNGEDECTKEISSVYAVNKHMIDAVPAFLFKSWLDDRIQKNEEEKHSELATYPSKPVFRVEPLHKMTSTIAGDGDSQLANLYLLIFIIASFQSVW